MKMNYRNTFLAGALALTTLLTSSCKGASGSAGTTQNGSLSQAQTTRTKPQFCADSAYLNVAAQCAFGPRVPGTDAHRQCSEWLEQELKRHGAVVKVYEGEMKTFDGKTFNARNVFGSINPNAKMRVLLMSHWDSRPFSDQEETKEKQKEPVMGANDGASGVGVLLELARLTQEKMPQVGIDVLLDDLEDYGAPDYWNGSHDEKWWAMGTQLWCKQAAREGYRAQYGILLDMVGSPNATFYREYYSERFAPAINNEIWSIAARLGFGDVFVNRDGGGVTDDHVFVNKMLGIPTVDIIDYRMGQDSGFDPVWHTNNDTMDNISAETLRKVGEVLVEMLW